MRVLFIVGGELGVNSSANLCHLAYIRGFCEAGHTVDVLSAKDEGARIDSAMSLPAQVKNHYTSPVSLYEKISHIKNRAKRSADASQTVGTAGDAADEPLSAASKIKARIRALYGVYGTDAAWLSHVKKFRSEKYYDAVISLSCPFVSHKAAEYLIESGRIDCGKWIQLWEDPWYGDLACDAHNEACLAEERRLVSAARDIVYVSPVTLMYQQRLFPESAAKMRFVPTPSYYVPDPAAAEPPEADAFGYFGDYDPAVRNLAPFYEAAKETGVDAYICGNSPSPLRGDGKIRAFPRMPLSELHTYEDRTGTLVFLCNLRGGQIPGKIFQYSAQNKPILFILDGTDEEKKAIFDYFSAFGRYVFCENEKEDIKRAIGVILAGDAPRDAIDEFSTPRTVERLMNGSQ
ncbi:MAG: hypothetical protein IJK23_11130 [Clostridia bacterium]|nr:hypothetical protein [Clostridia bacterium]